MCILECILVIISLSLRFHQIASRPPRASTIEALDKRQRNACTPEYVEAKTSEMHYKNGC